AGEPCPGPLPLADGRRRGGRGPRRREPSGVARLHVPGAPGPGRGAGPARPGGGAFPCARGTGGPPPPGRPPPPPPPPPPAAARILLLRVPPRPGDGLMALAAAARVHPVRAALALLERGQRPDEPSYPAEMVERLRQWGCEGPAAPAAAPLLDIEDDPCPRR